MAGFYAARSWIIPPLPWLDLQAPLPLDAHAAKAGPDGWLYGSSMTQADISATVAFTFATLARPKLGVAEKAPNLAKLVARLEATDAFKQTHPSA